MFRRVDLPAQIPGQLLLHSMPGRFESLDKVWHHVETEAIAAIVCLNEPHELRLKSWQYAEALENGKVPCAVVAFQISARLNRGNPQRLQPKAKERPRSAVIPPRIRAR